ncbi:MAG: sel1 repeat family protein, partial [Gammaproteobacteria bacterium]|nr:sel1 repeat family protein [Gammaproteobacteria bacterium]
MNKNLLLPGNSPVVLLVNAFTRPRSAVMKACFAFGLLVYALMHGSLQAASSYTISGDDNRVQIGSHNTQIFGLTSDQTRALVDVIDSKVVALAEKLAKEKVHRMMLEIQIEKTSVSAAIGTVKSSTKIVGQINQAVSTGNRSQINSLLFDLKNMAEHNGDVYAQYNLGLMYDTGHGVPRDDKSASQWYYKAAIQGDSLSQVNLGWLYENGEGVFQDYNQAVNWYRKAATQGDSNGQYYLGIMYSNARGVAQNDSEAVRLFRLSAGSGNGSGQRQLGWMYENGKGVSKSMPTALDWYRKAANRGNITAQKDLGELYFKGIGVPQDDYQSATWYQKAAQQGDASSQVWTGWFYDRGRGFGKDYNRALDWYRK